MKYKKISSIAVICFLSICGPLVYGEIIHLKTGKTVEGRIVEKNDKCIKVDVGGVTLTYYLDQIVTGAEQDKLGGEADAKKQEGENYIKYIITQKYSIQAGNDAHFLKLCIATPRKDIARQEINDIKISPNPNTTFTDNDANEIVVYYNSLLKGGSTFTVSLRYNLKLDITPFNIKPESIPDTYAALDDSTKKYLLAEGEVDPEDISIKEKAAILTTNINNPYKKAKSIYNFIADNFTYDLELFNQMQSNSGAYHSNPPPVTLIHKKGICYDFAKLFVAMSRSSGVPARVVRGIAFDLKEGQNRCIENCGHAWAEIFLPIYGWVPVDPTFGISSKKEYFCFVYKTHIPQEYGLSEIKDFGSLEKGWHLQWRPQSQNEGFPITVAMTAELFKE